MTPDIQRQLISHVKAMQHAYKWAMKGLALVKAGKRTAALAAEKKAQFWMAKAERIEKRTRVQS